jgi:putative NADH-flavin reductase
VSEAAGGPASKEAPPPKKDPTPTDPLQRVVVYGASGRVGSRIVTEALDRGLYVTGVIHKTPLSAKHPNLSTVRGDILDAKSIERVVAGHGTVINAAGGAAVDNDPEKSLALLGAKALVEASRALGEAAPRIIFIGGASTLLSESGVTFLEEMDPPPGALAARLRGHLLALQYFRGVDDVAWTVATPPRGFAPGPRTGAYRLGTDTPVVDEAGESKISMEDFAAAVIDEIAAAKYVGKRFTAAY